MATDYVLANFLSFNFTLSSNLGYNVPQSKVGNNVKRNSRNANRRDRDETSVRLCNNVQFRQAAILPQKFSLYKVREKKRQF